MERIRRKLESVCQLTEDGTLTKERFRKAVEALIYENPFSVSEVYGKSTDDVWLEPNFNDKVDGYITRYHQAGVRVLRLRQRKKEIDEADAENWKDPISYSRAKNTTVVDESGAFKPNGRQWSPQEINGNLTVRMLAALHTVKTSRTRAIKDVINRDALAALLDSDSTFLEYDGRRLPQHA